MPALIPAPVVFLLTWWFSTFGEHPQMLALILTVMNLRTGGSPPLCLVQTLALILIVMNLRTGGSPPPFLAVTWMSTERRGLSYPIHSRFSSEVPDVRSDQIRSTDPYWICHDKLLHSYPVHIMLNTAYFLHLVYPPFRCIGYAFFRLCFTDLFHLWLISGYVYWSASLVIIFQLMIDF